MRKTRKIVAILATLAMLAALLVPMVGPAAAATTNSALTVPDITTGTGKTLGTLQLKEIDAGSIGNNQDVTITLLNGAKLSTGTSWGIWTGAGEPNTTGAWVYAPPTVGGDTNILANANLSIVSQSNTSVTIRTGAIQSGDRAYLRVYFINAVDVDKSGDVEVDIYAPNTGFTPGKVTLARAGSGATTTVAISTETVGSGSNRQLGTVRISERTARSLDTCTTTSNTIKLTLPVGFTWRGAANFRAINFSGAVNLALNAPSDRYAYITIAGQSTGSTPGMIQFAPLVDIDSNDAKKGDITLSVSGTNSGLTPADIIVGQYEDYNVTPSAESTPDIIAGKSDQKIATFILEESLAGSLIPNRTVRLTLQGNARWNTIPTIEVVSGDNVFTGPGAGATITSDLKTLELTVNNTGSTSASKIKFKNGTVDVGADMSGDLIAKLEGTAGVPTVEAPIAKVKAAVTASAASVPEVKIGLQDQVVGDITITEVKGGIMERSGNAQIATSNTIPITRTARARDERLILEAPNGVTFANVPTVQVTEGDLQVDTANVRRTANDTQLIIPIKTESSKASTIKISNVKVTVDRTVPEGPMVFKVKGLPVVETDNVFPGAASAAKVTAANCVTPAPPDQKPAGKVVFTINDTTFKVGDTEQTMDVAPYIKDGRTFIPVRYAAQACGVTAENILYSDGKVTLIKGDKVVQLTIGSNVMLINGVAVNMDVAAELSNDRTMLPFRWVAQALGAKVTWDEATQTVTMEL